MKIKLTLVLILLVQVVFAQKRQRVEFKVDDLYKGIYSEIYEQPLLVEYTVKCPNGQASRSGMDFYTDSNIYTSDDEDYIDNVWDKGHLAPAASFSCDTETLKKTFSYLNSALQHQNLNRGQWSQLESFERDLANFYEVKVKVEVLFEGKLTVLPSGATVPSGFIKTIEFDGRKIVFKFPNNGTHISNWIEYRTN